MFGCGFQEGLAFYLQSVPFKRHKAQVGTWMLRELEEGGFGGSAEAGLKPRPWHQHRQGHQSVVTASGCHLVATADLCPESWDQGTATLWVLLTENRQVSEADEHQDQACAGL